MVTQQNSDSKPSKNGKEIFLSRFTPIKNDPEHPRILPEIQERVKSFQLCNQCFISVTHKKIFVYNNFFFQESMDNFNYLQRATKLIVVIKSVPTKPLGFIKFIAGAL